MRLSYYWSWISSKHCESSLRIHSAIHESPVFSMVYAQQRLEPSGEFVFREDTWKYMDIASWIHMINNQLDAWKTEVSWICWMVLNLLSCMSWGLQSIYTTNVQFVVSRNVYENSIKFVASLSKRSFAVESAISFCFARRLGHWAGIRAPPYCATTLWLFAKRR